MLRGERLDRDLTLQEVADAAGISMPYLSEVERGRKEASSEVLAATADALGLDLADLLALSHRRLVRLSRARIARAASSPADAGPTALAA